MKAIVKKYSKHGLSIEDMPIPEIGTNDLLIKVLKTAICGTDNHIYKWDKWAQEHIKPPIIIRINTNGIMTTLDMSRLYLIKEKINITVHM